MGGKGSGPRKGQGAGKRPRPTLKQLERVERLKAKQLERRLSGSGEAFTRPT